MQTKLSLARFVRFRNSDELVQGSALAAKIDGRTSGHSKKICDPLRSLQVILSFNRHVGWANFDRFASAGPSVSWRPNEPRHGSAEALFIADGQRMDFIASTHCPAFAVYDSLGTRHKAPSLTIMVVPVIADGEQSF